MLVLQVPAALAWLSVWVLGLSSGPLVHTLPAQVVFFFFSPTKCFIAFYVTSLSVSPAPWLD